MPAAAVIPAPIAYIKVVAVKKLVVEFQGLGMDRPRVYLFRALPLRWACPLLCAFRPHPFTVKKLECLKQA